MALPVPLNSSSALLLAEPSTYSEMKRSVGVAATAARAGPSTDIAAATAATVARVLRERIGPPSSTASHRDGTSWVRQCQPPTGHEGGRYGRTHGDDHPVGTRRADLLRAGRDRATAVDDHRRQRRRRHVRAGGAAA